MKPILVQQRSNGTLWWVVDWKISVKPPHLTWGWGNRMRRVYTLIPADTNQGGSRICYADDYTFLSN